MTRSRLSLLAVLALAAPLATAAAAVRDHRITPEDYFSLALVERVALSPDGQRVAYTEMRWGGADERRTTDLWVVDAVSGSRRRLTFDRVGASSPQWSDDGTLVYFTGRLRRAGEERPPYDGSTQVWRVAPTGGEPFPVTRFEGGVELFELAGGTLFFVRGQEVVADEWKALQEEFPTLEYGSGKERLSQLWALDLESWQETKVLDPQRVIRELSVSPDRSRIALVTTPEPALLTHEGWSQLDLLDLASGRVEVLTGPDFRRDHPSPHGWLASLEWAPDGLALAFTVSFDGYPTELYLAEWGGGPPALRTLQRPDGVSLREGTLAWRAGSRTLCFAGDERARTRVYAVDLPRGGGQGPARVLTAGDVVVQTFALARSDDALAAAIATTDHLADLFLLRGSGEPRRLTRLNPQVDTWKLPQISVVSWTGSYGDRVEGVLELPPDYTAADGPLPMVVEVHGGPTSATPYCLEVAMYGRGILPAQGYALLSPNYRGSTGYGDLFMTGLVGRENDLDVTDILTGVDAMVSSGVADPARLGVIGWSNGGFLVNCLITRTDRFKAASSGAGVLDQVIQWGTEDTPGHVVNFMRGLPWQTPDAYRRASPVYALDKVTTPTLIHVGGDDPRVPPAHSRALFRALRHYLQVPTQLVVYPGEGHGLAVRKHRLAKMKWDLAWFGKYLS